MNEGRRDASRSGDAPSRHGGIPAIEHQSFSGIEQSRARESILRRRTSGGSHNFIVQQNAERVVSVLFHTPYQALPCASAAQAARPFFGARRLL